jgi:hypothetical protein
VPRPDARNQGDLGTPTFHFKTALRQRFNAEHRRDRGARFHREPAVPAWNRRQRHHERSLSNDGRFAFGTAAAWSPSVRKQRAKQTNQKAQERNNMKRTSAFLMAAATMLIATAAHAEWPRGQEIQSPRGQEIQSPRGLAIQLPRD